MCEKIALSTVVEGPRDRGTEGPPDHPVHWSKNVLKKKVATDAALL